MKRKNIAINATFLHENPTGLSVYTQEMIGELLKLSCNYSFFGYTNSDVFKNHDSVKFTPVSPYTTPSLGFRGHLARLAWEWLILPTKVNKRTTDLVYSTVPEGMLYPRTKQVITIHDIIPAKYPELHPKMKYYYQYCLPLLLKNSSAIVCVSENTKNDVMQRYNLKDKNIYVIPEGFNQQRFFVRQSSWKQRRFGATPFFLCVGDMRPYKNLGKTLEAFSMLKNKDVLLAISGKKDAHFFPAIKRKVCDLSLEDRVRFLGYVPENELPSLYSEAVALVFPSLYEGFGLPALEAMACGCPVIASRTSSLPEVCANAAHYIDPYESESIADGMRIVLMNDGKREKLIQNGLERSRSFSWKKSATDLVKVFDAVLDTQ